MKEKMECTAISVRSTTAFFTTLLILISSVHSFYLPGVAPRDFQTV
ncbi:endomembrane 70 family protein, partial [Trifolium medium]|nr:endomembrane 70 family protein [Trifolium medium]